MLSVMQELDKTKSVYTGHRLQMLTALVQFYKVVDSHEYFLTKREVATARQALSDFLLHYTWLSNDAIKRGLVRWQVTIKFHYLCHASETLAWSNPRWASTYAGESFVGKIAKIAFGSSLGKAPHELGGLLMHKLQAGRAVRRRMNVG